MRATAVSATLCTAMVLLSGLTQPTLAHEPSVYLFTLEAAAADAPPAAGAFCSAAGPAHNDADTATEQPRSCSWCSSQGPCCLATPCCSERGMQDLWTPGPPLDSVGWSAEPVRPALNNPVSFRCQPAPPPPPAADVHCRRAAAAEFTCTSIQPLTVPQLRRPPGTCAAALASRPCSGGAAATAAAATVLPPLVVRTCGGAVGGACNAGNPLERWRLRAPGALAVADIAGRPMDVQVRVTGRRTAAWGGGKCSAPAEHDLRQADLLWWVRGRAGR